VVKGTLFPPFFSLGLRSPSLSSPPVTVRAVWKLVPIRKRSPFSPSDTNGCLFFPFSFFGVPLRRELLFFFSRSVGSDERLFFPPPPCVYGSWASRLPPFSFSLLFPSVYRIHRTRAIPTPSRFLSFRRSCARKKFIRPLSLCETACSSARGFFPLPPLFSPSLQQLKEKSRSSFFSFPPTFYPARVDPQALFLPFMEHDELGVALFPFFLFFSSLPWRARPSGPLSLSFLLCLPPRYSFKTYQKLPFSFFRPTVIWPGSFPLFPSSRKNSELFSLFSPRLRSARNVSLFLLENYPKIG